MLDERQELLERYPKEIQGLVLALRELVLSAIQTSQERVYMGWKIIAFFRGSPNKGQVCSIMPAKGWVNLLFQMGRELDDPLGLIQGEGKRMVFVRLKPGQDMPREALVALLQQADTWVDERPGVGES